MSSNSKTKSKTKTKPSSKKFTIDEKKTFNSCLKYFYNKQILAKDISNLIPNKSTVSIRNHLNKTKHNYEELYTIRSNENNIKFRRVLLEFLSAQYYLNKDQPVENVFLIKNTLSNKETLINESFLKGFLNEYSDDNEMTIEVKSKDNYNKKDNEKLKQKRRGDLVEIDLNEKGIENIFFKEMMNNYFKMRIKNEEIVEEEFKRKKEISKFDMILNE